MLHIPHSLLYLTLALAHLRLANGRVVSGRANAPSATSKAGLTWPNGNSIDVKQYLTTSKVSWYYNWSPQGSMNDIEFVPMLWGQKDVDQWQANIQSIISQESVKAVLGMNEPQETGQSNLTPQQGADMWKTYIEPLKSQGIRLGSPAPSGNPNGRQWIADWLTACAGGCNPDFIAIHWYDVNATQFQENIQTYHDLFHLPIWVTEWACQNFNDVKAQCSMSDIVSLMNQTQSFMDNTDYVERYAWFGAFEDLGGVNPEDGLMTTSGQINDLGKQYIGAEAPNPTASSGPGGPIIIANGATLASSASVALVVLLIVASTLLVA